MMMQQPKARIHKNITTMGKVDTSDLMKIKIYPLDDLNESFQHIKPTYCEDNREGNQKN